MDLIRPLVRYVTNPLYVRRDGYNYSRHRRALDESQWLPPDELMSLQLSRLRDHLSFCFAHNSFYRSRMQAAGIVPSDIRSIADLGQLPLLTKNQIVQAGSTLFSSGYSAANSVHTRTGGSTGVPLHVYVDREALNWKYAATWRHNQWAGWRPGDRVAAIWGNTARSFTLKSWLRNTLQHRMVFLDTLRFSTETCQAFFQELKSFRPTILFGHAHSVYLFARFCEERDLRIPRISGVVTTAMTLSDTERRTIESVMRAPVFNRYGCEELSIIASESEAHSGLHVFSEGLIVEYRPTQSPLEHEIVITDLMNRAMPMVRYVIGDVARPAEGRCPSGRGLLRFERVSGRTADFLYRPDGSQVFGISLLDTHIIHIAGIHQAQLIQNDISELLVRLVVSDQFTPATIDAVRGVIEREFGAGVRVHVVCVDKLEQTERGKYRFSICNIPSPLEQTTRPAPP